MMKQRYVHRDYPDEFPFRCKCVLVFQRLDGVDVILFALYLYEHGENNPSPNKRTVYISYLDSVHFMRPRKIRTFVYHEIMIAYLDYARKKGFATAHIWACPPLKGDDYIFYAKPEDQKTPKDTRLRQWYIDMLVKCQRREIVGRLTNMYDLYFSDGKLDASAVPYFEGDYFPGEAENIIKDLKQGKVGKNSSLGKKSKKKKNGSKGNSKSKIKGTTGRGGTRSNGMDNDLSSQENALSFCNEDLRDPVMVKLGAIIKPMKESFIVAFLNWNGSSKDDMAVPKEIIEYRERTGEKTNINENESAKDKSVSRKRDSNGNVLSVRFGCSVGDEPVSKASSASEASNARTKILDDDLEELDCEFFNTRQAFLNLCRGNHYQFDDLRRAKHTSMMILWHLNNRDANKFVQQCASCSQEILSGIRYHCSTCPDFDLCDECFRGPSSNRGLCTHKLEPIRVEADNSQGQNNSGNILNETQRKERQRNIRLHIQLLEHAAQCSSANCSSSNCAKMKMYLNHGKTCKVRGIDSFYVFMLYRAEDNL